MVMASRLPLHTRPCCLPNFQYDAATGYDKHRDTFGISDWLGFTLGLPVLGRVLALDAGLGRHTTPCACRLCAVAARFTTVADVSQQRRRRQAGLAG